MIKDRNTILCPHCKTGTNSTEMGGNTLCFHCGTCEYIECYADVTTALERERKRLIREIKKMIDTADIDHPDKAMFVFGYGAAGGEIIGLIQRFQSENDAKKVIHKIK